MLSGLGVFVPARRKLKDEWATGSQWSVSLSLSPAFSVLGADAGAAAGGGACERVYSCFSPFVSLSNDNGTTEEVAAAERVGSAGNRPAVLISCIP